MLEILNTINYICIFMSVINVINMVKGKGTGHILNNIAYLLIAICVWYAHFFYIDALNLNGEGWSSILVLIQGALVIITLWTYTIKIRWKTLVLNMKL